MADGGIVLDSMQCTLNKCPIDTMFREDILEIKADVKDLKNMYNTITTVATKVDMFSKFMDECRAQNSLDHRVLLERLERLERDKVSKRDLYIVVSIISIIVSTILKFIDVVLIR